MSSAPVGRGDPHPRPDGSFDVVLPAFGAALGAARPPGARDLVRVLRPGGRLALAAWTPDTLPGALDAHITLPDGILPPTAWADEDTARRRFEPEPNGSSGARGW